MVAQTGQPPDISAALALSDAKLIELLKVQPEFRTGPEKMSETKRGIASYRALAIENVSNAIRGNFNPTGQLRSAHAKRPELFGKLLARMNCLACHETFPLVIVNHFNMVNASYVLRQW